MIPRFFARRALQPSPQCISPVRLLAIAVAASTDPLGSDVHAAAAALPDFVVVNSFNSSYPGAVFRYTTLGLGDPAPVYPGGATVLPDQTDRTVAWGPDGNLYRLNTSGAIDRLDATTYAVTTFIAAPNPKDVLSIAFGPDGNLYASTTFGEVDRFCGPTNPVCVGGVPLPSGQTGGFNAGFYALTDGIDPTFGADGNLYVRLAQDIVQRFCGPANPSCAAGSKYGINGDPIDATFVSAPSSAFKAMSFGPDGNLYITATTGILRFCGGYQNHSSCQEGLAHPAAGQTGAVFVPTGTGGFSSASAYGLDFGPDGKLYAAGTQYVYRFTGPNCSPAPCEGLPDGSDPPSSLLVTAAGANFLDLEFSHPFIPLPPPTTSVLLVGDLGANKILRYDLITGAPYPASGQAGADFVPVSSGGLQKPEGMVIGPDGDLYVSSTGSNSILRFDASSGMPKPASGQSGADFVPSGFQGLAHPQGIAFGPDGDLYVANSSGGNVLRFDGATGAAMPSHGNGAEFVAAGAGGLATPTGVAFGLDGDLYVSDLGQDFVGSVLRYNAQAGEFIDTFVGHLQTPEAIVFGPDGNLYVGAEKLVTVGLDTYSEPTIQRFDGLTGTPLPAFGETGADFVPDVGQVSPPQVGLPVALTFGADGQLYVPSKILGDTSGRILRYDGLSGNPIDTFVSIGIDQAFSLLSATVTAPSLSGNVYHDSVAPGNVLVGAEVQSEQELVPGLFSCPIGGILVVACPSATTDVNGAYTLLGLQLGTFLVTAWPPPGLDYFPNAITVVMPTLSSPPVTGKNIVLLPPTPIPAGTTLSPSNPVAVSGGEVPVVTWNTSFTISTQACTGGNGQFSVRDGAGNTLVPNSGATGALAEGPAGTYTGAAGPLNPFKGAATVSIVVTCPSGPPQSTDFLMYIDPSGSVIDAVSRQPVAGATVTLLRSDTAQGTFVQVPGGSAIMSLSNRNNPDLTDANGAYGWDVVPGYYQLEASAPGYVCDPNFPPQGFTCEANDTAKSGVFAIPPAVTALTVPLLRDEIFAGAFEANP